MDNKKKNDITISPHCMERINTLQHSESDEKEGNAVGNNTNLLLHRRHHLGSIVLQPNKPQRRNTSILNQRLHSSNYENEIILPTNAIIERHPSRRSSAFRRGRSGVLVRKSMISKGKLNCNNNSEKKRNDIIITTEDKSEIKALKALLEEQDGEIDTIASESRKEDQVREVLQSETIEIRSQIRDWEERTADLEQRLADAEGDVDFLQVSYMKKIKERDGIKTETMNDITTLLFKIKDMEQGNKLLNERLNIAEKKLKRRDLKLCMVQNQIETYKGQHKISPSFLKGIGEQLQKQQNSSFFILGQQRQQ